MASHLHAVAARRARVDHGDGDHDDAKGLFEWVVVAVVCGEQVRHWEVGGLCRYPRY